MKRIVMTIICAAAMATGLHGANGTWSATGAGPYELNDSDNWSVLPSSDAIAFFNSAMDNTLYLTDDFSVNQILFLNQPVRMVLDLGGHTLSVLTNNNHAFVVNSGSSITLTNGTLNVPNSVRLNINYSGNFGGVRIGNSSLKVVDKGVLQTGSLSVGHEFEGYNSATFTDGAQGILGNFTIGYGNACSDNTMLLTDGGTVVSITAGSTVGNVGTRNALEIKDNAALLSTNVPRLTVGAGTSANDNKMFVHSGGSFSNIELFVGNGINNKLIVSNTTVFARNFFLEGPALGTDCNNQAYILGGTIWTNSASGTSRIFVGDTASTRGARLYIDGAGTDVTGADVNVGQKGHQNKLYLTTGAVLRATSLSVGSCNGYNVISNSVSENEFIIDKASAFVSGGITVGGTHSTGYSWGVSNAVRVSNNGVLSFAGINLGNGYDNNGNAYPNRWLASYNKFIIESGSSVTNVGSSYITIGNGGCYNELIMDNGTFHHTASSDRYFTIGNQSSSTGNVLRMTDSKIYLSAAPLFIGQYGSSNKVEMTRSTIYYPANQHFRIGNNVGSEGNSLVMSESHITSADSFFFGNSGTHSSAYLTNSTITLMGYLGIGLGADSYSNVMEIAEGSIMSGKYFQLGGLNMPNSMGNRLTIRDANSAFYVTNGVAASYIGGERSDNAVEVLDGAKLVMNGTLYVGGRSQTASTNENCSMNNSLTVRGGATFISMDYLYVGYGSEYGVAPNSYDRYPAPNNRIEVLDGSVVLSGYADPSVKGDDYYYMPICIGNQRPSHSNEVRIVDSAWTNFMGRIFVGHYSDYNKLVLSNGTFCALINEGYQHHSGGGAVYTGYDAGSSNNFIVIMGTNSQLHVGNAFVTRNAGGLDFTVGRKGYARTPVVVDKEWSCQTSSRLIVNATEWAAFMGGKLTLATWEDGSFTGLTPRQYINSADLGPNPSYWLDIDGKSIVLCAPSKTRTQILVR